MAVDVDAATGTVGETDEGTPASESSAEGVDEALGKGAPAPAAGGEGEGWAGSAAATALTPPLLSPEAAETPGGEEEGLPRAAAHYAARRHRSRASETHIV